MKIALLIKQIRDSGIDIKLLDENLELIFREEDIDDAVIELVKSNKKRIITYLKSISSKDTLKEISRVPIEDTYSITSSQFRFWILCQMEEINVAYNMPLILKIEENINIDILNKSFFRLINRHEVLRTSFTNTKKGEVRQKVLEINDVDFNVNCIEIGDNKTLDATISKLVRTPFDFSKAPLFRADLIQKNKGKQENYLCFNIHHIICDGSSLEIILKELMYIYSCLISNTPVDLPGLKLQFKDYSNWSNDKTVFESEEKYWLDNFSGTISPLNLPTSKPRPRAKTYNGSIYTHSFDRNVIKKLTGFSNKNRGTHFMALMSALNGLLFRYTTQTDIVLGTPVSGRNHKDLENQIGLYINTIPIRTRFDANTTFKELFRLQKEILQLAYKNAGYSFGDLVNNLNLSGDINRSPLFDVLVIHQKESNDPLALETELKYSIYNNSENVSSKYDLTFNFLEKENGLSLAVEYNTDLFHKEFINNLAHNYEVFLKECLNNPEQEIQKASYIESKQVEQLLHSFNSTKLDYDTTNTVVSLFQKQVKKTPKNIALICRGEQITYKELDEKSTSLARHLKSIGVVSDITVGVCLGRSIEMIIGMLGILKSGASYLPLDPFYPLNRIDYIIENSTTKFILTDNRTKELITKESTVINLEDPNIWEVSDEVVLPSVTSNAMAYVIYTSGSTGKPKGVKISHKNLLNFMQGMNQKFETDLHPDIWLAITSISFDISVLELFWTLTRGSKVVIHLEKPVSISTRPEMDFSIFYFPTGKGSESNKYKLLLEGARFADENGFEAIWVPERHFHSFGDQFPNPSVAAAAVSTITKNIKLRSGSVVLPLHDPVRVAEEWSMIDNLSEGRVELSIASGWHPNDFVLAPGDFKNRHQIMRDKIDSLKSLWRGDSMIRKNGIDKDFEFQIHPKPIQKELPIWITAAGSIETFKYAGNIGANILTHLLAHTIDELADKVKAYRKALEENGFDPKQGKVALMLHTFVSDDADFVKKTVKEPFKDYLKNSANLLRPLAEEAALDLEQDIDRLLEMGFIRYYNTGSLFGTPETCLNIVNKLYKIGVTEIACLIDFGVDKDLVISNLNHLNRLKELIRKSKLQYDYIAGRMNLLDKRETTTSLIKEYEVTHMQSTPSFYEELILNPEGKEALKNIKTLLVGGEALKKSLARKILETRQLPIYNMFGPTETTIWSSVKTINSDDNITIGSPIANTSIYILDTSNQLCPVGVPGELCIGGDGVSLGYLNNKALTDSKFIANPFVPNEKIYKTGDLARWLSNGELEFLGRLDNQIKIKGYRIELKGIENVILETPGIEQCIVSAVPQKEQTILVAYIIANKFYEESYIKEFLRIELPDYMIPQKIITLKEFPYTPNGKIDIKKLPHSTEHQLITKKYVAPRNKLESDLDKIWRDFLKIDKISIDDNFFEIGGNSMKAFQLLAVLNSTLGLDLKIVAFFQYPTIRTLAESLDQKKKGNIMEVEENEMENVDGLIDFMAEL